MKIFLSFLIAVTLVIAGAPTAFATTTRTINGSQADQGAWVGRNYITNSIAQFNTSGWVTYADANSGTYVDGTAGSATATWTRSTSTPIKGDANFVFTPGTNGDGASFAFTADAAQKGLVTGISFDYTSTGTTPSTGDTQVQLYDVTNSAIVTLSVNNVTGVAAGTPAKFQATFTMPATSTSYRLSIHQHTATSTYTYKITNVVVGPGVPYAYGITGTLPVVNGGTGLTAGTSGGVPSYTASGTITSSGALAQNGIVLGGGAGAVPTTLATDSSTTKYLKSGGTNTAPAWTAYAAPTIQKFTTGSGTYTTPAGVVFLHVRMVGGGGGASGSGTASSSSNGSSGTASTWKDAGATTTYASAGGGTGAAWAGDGGSGGTSSITAPAIGTASTGENGYELNFPNTSTASLAGGHGGNTIFGTGGKSFFNSSTGGTAATNSGGGGGGSGTAGVASAYSGSGGGAGGLCDFIYPSPAATFTYAVGSSGAGGAAGTSGAAGGAGAVGYIEVTEFYQ